MREHVEQTRMIAYLEDAPADTGTVARGLSKAIIPLLRSIDGQVSTYYVRQIHARIPTESMPAFVREKLIQGPAPSALARNIWKLVALLPLPLVLFLMFCLGPGRHLLSPSAGVSILWAPVGVDPGTLVRAWAFSQRTGLRLFLYFVDDVESHPSNSGLTQLGTLIARIVRDADRVYTITPELEALFIERYGVKARALPLITESIKPASTKQDTAFFAAYLGSINHLYESGLRHLIATTRELRDTTGQNLQLRLFSDTNQVRKICDGVVPAWITPGSEGDDDIIHHELAAATLCYLPNSFDEDARTMVSTSFPSKLLTYLVSARAIVVFAPEYAVARRIFSTEGIPCVVSTAANLFDTLSALAITKRSYRDTYLSLVDRQFSADSVQRILSEPW